jgi:hypothetical protein
VFAFKTWQKYLLDVVSPTLVLSDHKNLEFYQKAKDLNRRQAHWIANLMDYQFHITYLARKQNQRADKLS